MLLNKKYFEVNLWFVLLGIVMVVLFLVVVVYLGLKVGQVFEVVIFIVIIVVGVLGVVKCKNVLGENVII